MNLDKAISKEDKKDKKKKGCACIPLSLIIFVKSCFLYKSNQSLFRGFSTDWVLHISLIYKKNTKSITYIWMFVYKIPFVEAFF